MGRRSTADYDRIRDLIARVVPGFDDFDARVRAPGGFQLPNVGARPHVRDHRRAAQLHGRHAARPALPPGRLRLMTIRSHDQYNTTIYGLDDRYRGIRGGRRVVFMHAADMVERGLVEREVVDLISEWHDGERVAEAFVVVPFDLPRGNAASLLPGGQRAGAARQRGRQVRTPTSKSIVIRVRKR